MVLTLIICALAACGVLLIACSLADALRLPVAREDSFFVLRLEGEPARVQQSVRACLRLRERHGLGGTLIFVDGGLDAEGQMAAQLALKRQTGAYLCDQSQISELIRWEKETVGAGAD